jgi:hypothetical protein
MGWLYRGEGFEDNLGRAHIDLLGQKDD